MDDLCFQVETHWDILQQTKTLTSWKPKIQILLATLRKTTEFSFKIWLNNFSSSNHPWVNLAIQISSHFPTLHKSTNLEELLGAFHRNPKRVDALDEGLLDRSRLDVTHISKQPIGYVGVSENSGTPKSSILIGFSLINHPFWGTPIFGNTHIGTCDNDPNNYKPVQINSANGNWWFAK